MKLNDKKTLITIIVLLVIFLPLAVLGTFKHFEPKKDNIVDDNPNKEFIYNNKVYFYLNGKLSSTYDCDDCSIAQISLDDLDYHTNSYRNGTKEFGPIIDDLWGIFKHGERYALYNILGKMIANEYQDVKSYKVDSTNSLLIAKKNNKWGVTYLDMAATGLKNEYDYIALPAHFTKNVLETKKFIGKINLLWYILNPDGSAIRPAVRSEIVDFNDNENYPYYITYDNGYHIMDFNENEVLENLDKKNVYGVGKYIFVETNNNMLLIYEDCNGAILKNVTIPEYKEMHFSKNDDGIAIMIDGNLFETIELS